MRLMYYLKKLSASCHSGKHGFILLTVATAWFHPVLYGADAVGAGRVSEKLMQQKNNNVEGTVTGSDGQPLAGVTVMVKGVAGGTSTDIDGRFHISVDNIRGAVLLFSYVGMKPLEVKLNGRNVINVRMEDDQALLDEVMVVAYGTATKESFTGSAVSVKSDKLTAAAASKTSAVEALRGNVAGVRFSNTGGQPGDLSGVQIRGIGSINESTAPLYVVDGVTISSGLNMLNPEDIESMTVLKDAAATSLYGNRASNGVIIITTKKGGEGRAKVMVKYERAWSSQTMPRSVKGFWMNTRENTEYSMEALRNRYLYNNKALPWQEAYDPENSSIYAEAEEYALKNLHSAAKLVHPDDMLDGKFDYSTADLSKYLSNPRENNWEDALLKTGEENKLNVSATGGSQKLNYYASLGYVSQTGIVLGSSFDRFTGRISVNGNVGRFVTFSIGENVGYTVKDEATYGSYLSNPLDGLHWNNPSQPIYLPDGSFNLHPGYYNNGPNYLYAQEHNSYNVKGFSSISNLSFTVKFCDWLKFSTVNGIDINYKQDKQIWDPESSDGKATNGYVWQYSSLFHKMTTSNILSFNRDFGHNSLNALVGYEAYKYTYDNLSAEGQQYAYADRMFLGNASVPSGVGGYSGSDRMVSWIAKADYNYDGRYYISASYRRDGSSRFIAKNRWGNFWSVSGAWSIIKEKFMEGSHAWLDNLRLKLSYGTNGNQPSGYFNNLTTFGVAARHNLLPGIMANSLGNPDLTWENSYTWNAGFDFSVFNSRLGGTIEYYNRLTTDLIDWTNISYMTGWSSYIVNDGKLRNTGVEVTLTSRNIDSHDFLWTTDFNVSHMRAKIEDLNGGTRISHPFITKVGENLYSFYTRQWVGVDPETGQGLWKLNTKDEEGNVIDPDGVTTDVTKADRVVVGKGYPDWFGGLTNTLGYKGIEVSFLLTFTLGGDMWDNTHYDGVTDGERLGGQNFRKDAGEDYWKKPGDVAKNPIVISNNPLKSSSSTSTRRMISSDHLRLKTLTVGYNLPKKWLVKIGVQGVKVYMNANDILTFSKSKYVDPEVGLSGVSKSSYDYPMLKSWRLGVKLDF